MPRKGKIKVKDYDIRKNELRSEDFGDGKNWFQDIYIEVEWENLDSFRREQLIERIEKAIEKFF